MIFTFALDCVAHQTTSFLLLLLFFVWFFMNFLWNFFESFFTNSSSLHRTMTAICFVCNLPIMSHQVGEDLWQLLRRILVKVLEFMKFLSFLSSGLVWSGGNGWDDLMREQVDLIRSLSWQHINFMTWFLILSAFFLRFRSVNRRFVSG